MLFIKRLVICLILFVVGIVLVYYRERMARMIGKNDLAEKYLGSGGTYNMWILIGILSMIIGVSVLLGKCSYIGL